MLALARRTFPFIPEAILRVFADAWAELGDVGLALSAMRQSPRYDEFFPGNRRPDGTVRLGESEYLSTVEGYRRRLGEFGVPVGSVLTAEKQRQLIEGEVSAAEFGDRLNRAYTQVVANIAPVREFYAREFGAGGLSDAAIFASAITPGRSPLEFQRDIATAQVGGEAARAGFDLAVDEAERLRSFGLDQEAARSMFTQAQAQLPRLNELIARFNDPDDELTLDEFAEAVVIRDPDQLRQIERLFGRQRAAFSPTGSVAGDRSGRLLGLRPL